MPKPRKSLKRKPRKPTKQKRDPMSDSVQAVRKVPRQKWVTRCTIVDGQKRCWLVKI